jgi:hypothetical protein
MGDITMKVKETVNQTVDTTKRVASNSEQFVQAVALLVTASFSYWALSRVEVGDVAKWVVTGSLVVIGLRGAYELFRFLDKK